MFAVGEPLRHGPLQVQLVDDVVAVEHRPGFPAAELHDFAVRNTGSTQVPGCAPAKVVYETVRQPGATGRPLPTAPQSADPDALTAPLEHEQAVTGPVQLFEELLQFWSQPKGEEACVAALGVRGSDAD